MSTTAKDDLDDLQRRLASARENQSRLSAEIDTLKKQRQQRLATDSGGGEAYPEAERTADRAQLRGLLDDYTETADLIVGIEAQERELVRLSQRAEMDVCVEAMERHAGQMRVEAERFVEAFATLTGAFHAMLEHYREHGNAHNRQHRLAREVGENPIFTDASKPSVSCELLLGEFYRRVGVHPAPTPGQVADKFAPMDRTQFFSDPKPAGKSSKKTKG